MLTQGMEKCIHVVNEILLVGTRKQLDKLDLKGTIISRSWANKHLISEPLVEEAKSLMESRYLGSVLIGLSGTLSPAKSTFISGN